MAEEKNPKEPDVEYEDDEDRCGDCGEHYEYCECNDPYFDDDDDDDEDDAA